MPSAKMKVASKEEKIAMREKMTKMMKEKGMRAPAMPMVTARLKSQLNTRGTFIAFVEDYIQHPSKEKGFCMPMAYKKFGTMPPIGKGLTPKERKSVAGWMYDTYKSSGMCASKGKGNGMKCGSGKCGAKKEMRKASKCGAGKCGSVNIETH